MNGQIVLCKGVNDGDELERSIRDLTAYIPLLRERFCRSGRAYKVQRRSVSFGAVYERGCQRSTYQLSTNGRISIYEEYGIHFIHAGDEWYLLAGEEVPEEERYDGYLQLENGVGMLRLLL